MSYLLKNNKYWERGYKGYPDENVESFIFRPYGRIIADNYKDGESMAMNKKMLDFGCGSGQPTNFFKSKGFDVFGVDISDRNIQICKSRFWEMEGNFQLIEPQPNKDTVFFDGNFGLITAIQSLYYFSNADLNEALQSLHKQLVIGGLIYATMIGSKSWCFENSSDFKNGLRSFSANTRSGFIDEHYVNFTHSEDELVEKFSLFEPLHIGFHSEKYRSDEGVDFHYTFVGIKR